MIPKKEGINNDDNSIRGGVESGDGASEGTREGDGRLRAAWPPGMDRRHDLNNIVY